MKGVGMVQCDAPANTIAAAMPRRAARRVERGPNRTGSTAATSVAPKSASKKIMLITCVVVVEQIGNEQVRNW
jgi:hypothetical protein